MPTNIDTIVRYAILEPGEKLADDCTFTEYCTTLGYCSDAEYGDDTLVVLLVKLIPNRRIVKSVELNFVDLYQIKSIRKKIAEALEDDSDWEIRVNE